MRFGLLGRVALALAAVGLLPLALASLRLLRINQEALVEHVLRTHTVAATTAAERVAAFLATRESLARGAAASPELADPRSPAAQRLLAGSLQAWADLGALGIAVLDPRGEEEVRAQLRGVDARSAVAAALQAPGRFAGVAVTGRNPLILRLATPLAAGGGSLVLICRGAPLDAMARPEELGEQADLVIAEKGGVVVAGSLPSLAGMPREMLDLGLSGRLAGAGRFESGKETILGAYAPVPGSGWVVLSRQPTRVAEAVAARMRRQAALALGLSGLLIAGLSAGAWWTVVKPIRRLVAAQRSLIGLGRGKAGGSEIEDLRRTFDALKRNLSERQALDDVFLGRYQVTGSLGSGAMGSVFRGWDPRLQRPVALKTIHLGGVMPEKRKILLDTLLREAVALARLSHPHVVPVYDLEDAPEGAFIAMEFVEGLNLERLLWRRSRLAAEEVVPLGAAIARGLAAAHEEGIVHRDVKPANVLLGKNGAIKVTDFGIAGFLAGASQEEYTVFGTPGYLPPESLMGQGHGTAGDLFALGVLLYRCLSGVMPFAGDEPEEVLRLTLFGSPMPLTERVSGLPAELESLVRRLLDRDPAGRPASAAAVAAELERLAAAQNLEWKLAAADAVAPSVLPRPEVTVALEARWVSTRALTPTIIFFEFPTRSTTSTSSSLSERSWNVRCATPAPAS